MSSPPLPRVALALFALAVPAAAQCPLEKLVPDDGVLNARHGWSVDVDGAISAAGAYADTNGGIAVGAAYVYGETCGVWSLEQKLAPSDPDNGDGFGRSVSVSGTTVLVGAGDQDVGTASGQGSAYVFVRTLLFGNPVWTQQAKLVASDGAELDRFGTASDLDGDLTAVGAYSHGSDGAVYVFSRTGSNWTQEARLTQTDGTTDDWLGWSVAIDGNRLVAGAPFHHASWQGAAYVYQRGSLFGQPVWFFVQKLQPPTPESGDRFGWSVDIQGNRVAVGSIEDPFADPGKVYVFEDDGAGYDFIDVIDSPNPLSGGHFGASVALDGDRLLVGEHAEQAGGVLDVGTAYLFEPFPIFGSTIWIDTASFEALDEASDDGYGRAVGLSGDTAMVGAPFDDDWGTSSGGAWLFSVSGSGCPALLTEPPFVRVATGGDQEFRLDAGPAHAGALYLILGSASGTSPGTPAIPPPLVWPLNFDPYFNYLLSNPNTLRRETGSPLSPTISRATTTAHGIVPARVDSGCGWTSVPAAC